MFIRVGISQIVVLMVFSERLRYPHFLTVFKEQNVVGCFDDDSFHRSNALSKSYYFSKTVAALL